MKNRFTAIFCAVAILALQTVNLNVYAGAAEGLVSEQKDEITASGNGFFYEAEDAMYCNSFYLTNDSLASGEKGLKAASENKGGASSSERGEIELTFTADDSGTYVAWGRLYASNSGQDSLYAAFEGQSYTVVNFGDDYGEFTWIKLGSKYVDAKEKATLKIINREKNAIVDAFIVTPTSFVPTGITGNLPAEEIENTLTSFYEPTPVKPPSEHPRVLFTASDIPRIKANMQKDENQNAVNKLNSLIRYSTNGNSNGKYNLSMLCKIEAFAFDYAINANADSGNIAVKAILNYLDKVNADNYTSNYTREGGSTIYFVSKIYDWCYDLLTETQKKKIISKCEMLAHEMEMGWPPNDQGSVVGHGSEAQLLRDTLSFAIAVYDERPDIWEAVGGRFYEECVPARNYFNKSGWHHQGDSYGLYRHRWDAWSYFLITGMGHPSPYNDKDLSQMGYGHIYMRRPDGQYLRDGDSYLDTTYSMWEYWQNDTHTYLMDSVIGNDPYLKDEAFSQNTENTRLFDDSPTMYLIINNPDLKSASVKNLPKSRFFPDPSGMMIARTGWDKGAASDDVVVQMKIGGVQVNNHQHFDAGHFQIYYKGILASDSGVYQGLENSTAFGGTSYGSKHYNMYMTKTVAHNSVLVYDPNESNGEGNRRDITDGGQRAAGGSNEPWNIKTILNEPDYYRTGNVTGREIDPENPVNPEYTYIKGDLTKAYSDKVSDFKRSFMFFNFFDEEIPGALIVFDKITSSNADFKKTWLLHGVEKPAVNENQTVFSRTYQSPVTPSRYNGKMTVDTLLPKKNDAVISIVGGENDGFSNVNGVDYTGYPARNKVDEGNTYRMELSPKSANKTDYFLNVIQVSDNDKSYYIEPKLIENDVFYGVQIKDRAVFFSKSGVRIENHIKLELPEDNLKVTVCDAKTGKWTLKSGSESYCVYASEDGGVLSFEAGGKVELVYESNESRPAEAELVLGAENPVNVKIAGQYVHCETEPEIKEGKVMMPLSVIAEWFKINTVYSDDGITLIKKDTTAAIALGSTKLASDNIVTEMAVPVYEKNGEIMIPAEDIVYVFGGSTEWQNFYNLIVIELPPVDYSLPEGYAEVKAVTHDTGEIDGGNVAENAADGDGETIWAALGAGRYIDIELDKVYTLDRAEILFNPNSGRNAEFKIRISGDGIHYTTAVSGVSDGSIEGVAWETYDFNEPVSVKYLRYVGDGSDISDWNAIKEIRFREYKPKTATLEMNVDAQEIYACAGIKNESVGFKNGMIIIAQYSDTGVLLSLNVSDMHKIAPKIDYQYNFDFKTEINENSSVVKAFLWDGICTAKPYTDTVEYFLSE